MAIFKKFTVTKKGTRYSAGETNTGLVINPSDGDLWIDSQPYDSNTLYPLFSKSCTALKANKVYEEIAHGFVASAIIAKGPCLHNGQDTGTATTGALNTYSLGSRDHNLEDDKTLEMSSNMFGFTSTSNTKFKLLSLPYNTNTYYPPSQNYIFMEGDDLSNPLGIANGTYDHAAWTYESQKWPIYVDTTNKFMYFAIYYPRYNQSSYYYRTLVKGIAKAAYTTNEDDGNLSLGTMTVILGPNDGGSYAGGYRNFEVNGFYYCGKNNNGTLQFLETVENSTGSYVQQTTGAFENRIAQIFNAESYDVGAGTVQTVSTIGTASFTTSAAAVKAMLRPRPTQFMDSPIGGETNIRYSYYPVADVNFEVSFVLINWDRSANANAGSLTADNCTMTYNSGVVTDYLQFPTRSTLDVGTQIRSHSFITKVGADYFLHYLPSYSSPTASAAQPALAKNLVTYQIDATDFSSLTYHSSFQVNALDFVHLNSARTKIAVITPGALKVHTWNNGWSETATEPGDFIGVTQDDSGRIIGLSGSANNTTAPAHSVDATYSLIDHRVHLISDSLPSTVTVSFANTNLTYTGSNIATTINISAYDTASVRIAKSVDLKIDGANAQFSNSSTSSTVTCLTTGELSVALTVTGPGPLTISAAFAL